MIVTPLLSLITHTLTKFRIWKNIVKVIRLYNQKTTNQWESLNKRHHNQPTTYILSFSVDEGEDSKDGKSKNREVEDHIRKGADQ